MEYEKRKKESEQNKIEREKQIKEKIKWTKRIRKLNLQKCKIEKKIKINKMNRMKEIDET